MTTPLRLTVVMTHPAQNMSPWFRHIASERADLDLTVLYGALPAPSQQGSGFGRAFAWDLPLTDGYRFEVCGDSRGKSFDSDSYWGVDVPDLEARLAATRPDVVLVPGWHSIMQVRALRACRRLGVPVLYRGDSTMFSGPRGVVRPFWALRTRAMLRRFDGYLSVGAHATEYLRAFGVPEPLVVRSPHCVDNQRFAAAAAQLRGGGGRDAARHAVGAGAGDLVVLFAGKLQPRKRPLDAVRAVAALGAPAVLVIAGDGPLRRACQAEAERLGVRLAWTGFLNQSELPSAFAAADVVLVPSAWESWGLVVNEALASGVPCIVTTRVASARDLIVEEDTGHAVAPGDVAALAARLGAVRERLAAGHDFAPACHRQVEQCSFAAAAQGLAVACRRVIGGRIAADSDTRILACCGGMVSVFGMERSTFEVLRLLREHGAAVHCIVNSWSSSPIADLATSIGASWAPGWYTVPLRWRRLSPGHALRLVGEVTRVSAVVLRDAVRLRATHVLIPDLGGALYNVPALALLRMAGVKIVVKLGNAPETVAPYRLVWGRLINAVASTFVANSQFTSGALAATGVHERKIRVIGLAAPRRHVTGLREPAPKQPGRVIYVGQLIPPKGCDRLLDAIALLAARGLDVSLDVVGDLHRWEPESWRGYLASLQARAARADLAGRVRFLGEREDVPALLAEAVVHCFPSRIEIREGFGIVTVEAKTAGIPSVVTPSGALPEAIEHEQDGYLCRDDSAAAIADGLEFFLADPQRAAAAGRRALASARRYARERVAAAWLQVFCMRPPVLAPAPERPSMVHSHGD